MKSILVEYKDGSFQWIRVASEEEAKKNPEVARVKAECYGEMKSRRWRTGPSELQIEFFGELPA